MATHPRVMHTCRNDGLCDTSLVITAIPPTFILLFNSSLRFNHSDESKEEYGRRGYSCYDESRLAEVPQVVIHYHDLGNFRGCAESPRIGRSRTHARERWPQLHDLLSA